MLTEGKTSEDKLVIRKLLHYLAEHKYSPSTNKRIFEAVVLSKEWTKALETAITIMETVPQEQEMVEQIELAIK